MARVISFLTNARMIIAENMYRKSGAVVNAAVNRVWISDSPQVAVNSGIPLAQYQVYTFDILTDGEDYTKGAFFGIIDTAAGTGWFEESDEQ